MRGPQVTNSALIGAARFASQDGELGGFSTWKLHKRLHSRPQRPPCRLNTYAKAATCGAFAEPSDGLEPSTPSLPWNVARNRSQPTAMVLAYFCGSCERVSCRWLPPVATTGLHKGSIVRCPCWLRHDGSAARIYADGSDREPRIMAFTLRARCSECVRDRRPLPEALRDELGALLLAPAAQQLEVPSLIGRFVPSFTKWMLSGQNPS